MHAIPAMMNWKTIHLLQQHRKKFILFYAETVAGNLHFRNTKKAAALTAMQDLIQNAVYMRIFISVVQIQRIQNSKKFCILFLFVKKSDAETSFYYMGQFDVLEARNAQKEDNRGRMQPITKVTMKMHHAVREDLLRYLQSHITA